MRINIRTRMLLFILVPTIVGLIGTTFISYVIIQPKLQTTTINQLSNDLNSMDQQLEQQFIPTQVEAISEGQEVEQMLNNTPQVQFTTMLENYLQSLVLAHNNLYDSWVAFQPDIVWNATAGAYMDQYMPTFYSGNTTGSALPVEYYTDYFSEIYYNAAENASQFVWTAPYYDPVSQTVYITAGYPCLMERHSSGLQELISNLIFVSNPY